MNEMKLSQGLYVRLCNGKEGVVVNPYISDNRKRQHQPLVQIVLMDGQYNANVVMYYPDGRVYEPLAGNASISGDNNIRDFLNKEGEWVIWEPNAVVQEAVLDEEVIPPLVRRIYLAELNEEYDADYDTVTDIIFCSTVDEDIKTAIIQRTLCTENCHLLDGRQITLDMIDCKSLGIADVGTEIGVLMYNNAT